MIEPLLRDFDHLRLRRAAQLRFAAERIDILDGFIPVSFPSCEPTTLYASVEEISGEIPQ
jgi:hypothetical protein